jgi:hypothetical protein
MTVPMGVSDWFDAARASGATHLLVLVDYYSRENYSVPVMPGRDPADVVAEYADKPMLSVLEVYDLSMDRDTQLAESRAWHVGPTKAG